jgi:protein TonB
VATPEHQTPPAPEQPETAASATTDSPAADTATGEPEQSSSVELNAGTSQATDSYLGKLSRHLSRFYEYPRRARRLGQEGVPVIIFRFRRDGSLVKHYLQNSSGHELLDKAALDMLKQAEPLPPVPETMAGQTFSYALPIRFSLR